MDDTYYERLANLVESLRTTDKYKNTNTYHSLMDLIENLVVSIFSGNPVSLCLTQNSELKTLIVSFRIYYTEQMYLEYRVREFKVDRKISPSTWKKMVLDTIKAFKSASVGSITFK